MLSTREIFNYTLKTGRDIFDDFQELDRQQALAELGRPNEVGYIISEILSNLDLIGVTDIDLTDVLKPTIDDEDESEGKDEEDKKNFIPDPMNEIYNRTLYKTPKEVVSKSISSFILSKNIDSSILLDAPYDIVIREYNRASKIREDAIKKGGR